MNNTKSLSEIDMLQEENLALQDIVSELTSVVRIQNAYIGQQSKQINYLNTVINCTVVEGGIENEK